MLTSLFEADEIASENRIVVTHKLWLSRSKLVLIKLVITESLKKS